MQAIRTHFIPATNSRGSRVKATAQAGSVTLSWDDALDIDDNHQKAAQALCTRLNWPRRAAHGVLPDESHVWVPVRGTRELLTVNTNDDAQGV